jgi:hypothetical protein
MLASPAWPQFGRNRPQSAAQGIEAEIPQADRREAEELERKARSPRRGDAPKIQMSDEE